MPFIRALAPSAVLVCLIVAALLMLEDEVSGRPPEPASRAEQPAISPRQAGDDEADFTRWTDPPRRSADRRREALAISDEPAED
ncbi:hypothetical protein [Methylobacterium durans]|uniref:hypothetical protein n=1 Tax=Methylobacterium durans TaxID=2202825 RepID=UPI0013A59FDB|nr:hypothetical protein [Methylobacterium durans]